MRDEKNNQQKDQLNRRDFIRIGAAAGLGAAVAGIALQGCDDTPKKFSSEAKLPQVGPMDKVRIGFVGVGSQGSNHVKNFMRIDGVEIKAICDKLPDRVEKIQGWITEAGLPKPTGYSKGEHDFVRMCETEELDLVFTATPWNWHVPVMVAAMKNAKHAATEVPSAVTLDECWEMVETAEKFNRHCVMMENCNYGKRELTVLNMVRQGVFGEILHGACGYLHDLRSNKTGTGYVDQWRIKHSIKRNGNLYPTHGLGPVANCMNINRGDRFDYLVSMSTPARGLKDFAATKFGPESEFAKANYALGDVNVSMIKTVNGMTITLYHDTNLPRPYSRIDLVQGTKAISMGYPDQIHIEGTSPAHEWEPLEKYMEKYEHPLWRNIGELAKGAGHGGMDFLEDYRLIQCLQKGEPTDMDVYDSAALSCISEVSEISVANRSKPVDIPDFTRGLWKNRNPWGIVEG